MKNGSRNIEARQAAPGISRQSNSTDPTGAVSVALLTGGIDRPYTYGLAMELVSKGASLEIIGSDGVDFPEFHTSPGIRFFNLQGGQHPDVSAFNKVLRLARYYARLSGYALRAEPSIFHILWNNKLQNFDRTVLTLFYRALGRRVVLTVHNVNAAKRDNNDSFVNRLTLRIQYRLAHHIFVHSDKFRGELAHDYGVKEDRVTVIPFGINNAVPKTPMTSIEARQRLGIPAEKKTMLFFGRITEYKGLEYLVKSFERLSGNSAEYYLMIVGRPENASREYWKRIENSIREDVRSGRILIRAEHIPDEETEIYFKAADVFVLPYKKIYQSGVLFLGYSFGLPILASDVGDFREEIVEGWTGFVFKPEDPAELATTIEKYFKSDLFNDLKNRREAIVNFASERHSWDKVGQMTMKVYTEILQAPPGGKVSSSGKSDSSLKGILMSSISTPNHLGGDSESKRKVVQGVAWTGAANWGCQILSFVVYAGLARLLSPSTFGLVAIASIYISFMQVLVAQGFGMAIIQRKVLDREHLDSAFWIAIGTAVLLCLLTFLFAGKIAKLFHEPSVAPVISCLSLSFVFYALAAVPMAILTRELDFKALAIRSLVATSIAGAVGLGMAFAGFGVWSLVGQQLLNAFLGFICLWWSVSWRPILEISKRHLRDLYGFSLSVAGNDVLWFFSQKSDQTLVGYRFGSVGLGPYSLASRVVTLLYEGITAPLQSVAFPALSKLQSEPERFERALYKFCETCGFVAFPVFAGILALAPTLVPLLFGTKWMAAIPILQILSVYGAVRAALAFVHPLMLSKGRAGIYLVTNVVLSFVTLVSCLVAIRWGPSAVAISIIVAMLTYTGIFLVIVHRTMGMKIVPLIKAFAFPALASLLMVIVVASLRYTMSNNYPLFMTVAACVLVGMVVYILTAYFAKPDLVKEIWTMINSHLLPNRRVAHFDTSPRTADRQK
jgi:O-antigen/teichoic acid export membrane protein/glycosyltransferase involved in cell wall biosynthesis